MSRSSYPTHLCLTLISPACVYSPTHSAILPFNGQPEPSEEIWSATYTQSGKCLFIFSCMRDFMNFMRAEQSCKISYLKKIYITRFSTAWNLIVITGGRQRKEVCNLTCSAFLSDCDPCKNRSVKFPLMSCYVGSPFVTVIFFCHKSFPAIYSRAWSWFVRGTCSVGSCFFKIRLSAQQPPISLNHSTVTPNPDGVENAI